MPSFIPSSSSSLSFSSSSPSFGCESFSSPGILTVLLCLFSSFHLQFQLEFSVRKVKRKKGEKKEEKKKLPQPRKGWDLLCGRVWEEWGREGSEGIAGSKRRGCWTAGGKRGCRSGGRRESLLSSIFTGSELLNWELELERVPKTLQIQLHLERVDKEREAGWREKYETKASGEWYESRSTYSCYKSKY